jgi:hypothetical protein
MCIRDSIKATLTSGDTIKIDLSESKEELVINIEKASSKSKAKE